MPFADSLEICDPALVGAFNGGSMGRFIYDGATRGDFEDRALAHLQLVIGAKLRRGESFHFTWRAAPSTGAGRTAVWLNPAPPLVLRFAGSRQPSLNPAWIDALTMVASSPGGLHLVPEPAGGSAP